MSTQRAVLVCITCPDCPAPYQLHLAASIEPQTDPLGRPADPQVSISRDDLVQAMEAHACQHATG